MVFNVSVFFGFKDEGGEYHGFLGSLEEEEYTILKRLSERCVFLEILSTDELKTLSDVKDLLAKTQIKLYEVEDELSEEVNKKLEEFRKALGKALESFDVYREEAPQLDFLLSFCIIDASESDPDEDYRSGKFLYIYKEYEEELEVERPTKGKKADREEWIKYLASVKAIPIWDEKLQPFPVYFRRLTTQQEEGGVHLEGFGRKTRKRVAEILGIEKQEDCERVRGEIKERFFEETSLSKKIATNEVKYMTVPEDLVFVIYDWIELDGRRLLNEAAMAEDDEYAMDVEIEWWRDNMEYLEEHTEYNLTTMLFRTLRNNMLKSKRTGKLILSSEDWPKKTEVI